MRKEIMASFQGLFNEEFIPSKADKRQNELFIGLSLGIVVM
jgi:hypothetical protein